VVLDRSSKDLEEQLTDINKDAEKLAALESYSAALNDTEQRDKIFDEIGAPPAARPPARPPPPPARRRCLDRSTQSLTAPRRH